MTPVSVDLELVFVLDAIDEALMFVPLDGDVMGTPWLRLFFSRLRLAQEGPLERVRATLHRRV